MQQTQPGVRRRAAFVRTLWLAAPIAALWATGPAPAAAADFPERPIRLVVPFAAGGGVDALARPLAKEMSDILGKNVYVEVKPSATGQVGAIEVSMAPADGYTILISSAAFATTAAFAVKPPYDPVKQSSHITVLASTPQVLVATNEYKGKGVSDVLQAARERQPLNFALSGSTGIQALATALMSSTAKVEATTIPYKGAGAAFTDLIAGRVDLMFDNPASSMVHVRAGKLKLLATTGSKRMAALPDTPTVAETLPGFEALNWFVLAAPANTPAPVIEVLRKAANEALQKPALRQMFERDGLEPMGLTAAEARSFVGNETEKWTRVVKEKGLQVQ